MENGERGEREEKSKRREERGVGWQRESGVRPTHPTELDSAFRED